MTYATTSRCTMQFALSGTAVFGPKNRSPATRGEKRWSSLSRRVAILRFGNVRTGRKRAKRDPPKRKLKLKCRRNLFFLYSADGWYYRFFILFFCVALLLCKCIHGNVESVFPNSKSICFPEPSLSDSLTC